MKEQKEHNALGAVRLLRCVAAVLGVFLALAVAPSAPAQNLVGNPGLETGDLTDWTFTPAGSGSHFYIRGDFPPSMFAHSGYYCAAFGALYDENDLITQALTTTPGSTYTFSFWLAADAESYLTASWNGAPVLNITPASGGFWWEQFSFTETASGPNTTIGFAGRNAPAYIYLDDVSVTAAVPDGGATASLLGLGLLGLGALRRRQS